MEPIRRICYCDECEQEVMIELQYNIYGIVGSENFAKCKSAKCSVGSFGKCISSHNRGDCIIIKKLKGEIENSYFR